jgi:hypothetical protein
VQLLLDRRDPGKPDTVGDAKDAEKATTDMRARRKPDACKLGGVSAGPRSVMAPGAFPAT